MKLKDIGDKVYNLLIILGFIPWIALGFVTAWDGVQLAYLFDSPVMIGYSAVALFFIFLISVQLGIFISGDER